MAPRKARTAGKGPLGETEATRAMKVRQAAFLAAYAIHGNLTAAAVAADVNRKTVYCWMDEDGDFAEDFADAKEAFADQLVHEARRRAVEGVKDYVVSAGRLIYVDDTDNPGTPIPLVRQIYSDTLLLAMLKAHRPDEYKERSSVEHSGKGGGPVKVAPEVSSDFVADVLARLGEAGREPAAEGPG